MTTELKGLKDILDEVILAEKRCYEVMHSILLKENERFQSPVLANVALILNKMSNKPATEILKILESEYDKQNLG